MSKFEDFLDTTIPILMKLILATLFTIVFGSGLLFIGLILTGFFQ